MSDFKEHARDGDGDGLVQDGTEWERPVAEEAEEAQKESEAELFAEELGIEASVSEAVEEDSVISTPTYKSDKGSKKKAMTSVADGVIGTDVPSNPKAKVTNQVKNITDKTVAIYSGRNVRWEGVGKINKGYNILDPETADLWIGKLSHVRLATPEEVSRELG
jgi:hypothetical protein